MARQPEELTRQELEHDEDLRLAPFALRSAGVRRPVPLEKDGRLFDYRTEFQRDRDRILHSRAFRRLRLKSSGGAIPPAERYRDRLTHTLEVSQISGTVARGLKLNGDLVEAIALGHEIGMPPFGRAGQEALAGLLGSRAGGFRYNYQSLRVVDQVEKRYRHAGLNLTDPTREGILKHTAWTGSRKLAEVYASDSSGLHLDSPPFLEAQVVSVVNEVASLIQDVDDALRAGDLSLEAVERLPLTRALMRRIEPPDARKPGLHMRANMINRGLTHMLVTSIIHHSRKGLHRWTQLHSIESSADFLAARKKLPADIIGLTPPVRRLYDGLSKFVARELHQGSWFSSIAARARHLLAGLFRAITEDPRIAEDYLLLRFKELHGGRYLRDVPPERIETEIARRYRGNAKFERLVADHIAGMTDMFAIEEYERLLGPFVIGTGGRGPGAKRSGGHPA